MSRATLSLLGLYRNNPSLFSEMVVPNELDSETLIDNLLAEAAELEILYPDSFFMQAMIRRWSAKQLSVWKKLYETTQFEYEPIYNYDRTEEWTDENTRYASSSSDFKGKTNAQGTNDTETKVSAYNELSYTPRDQVSEGATQSQENDSSTSASSNEQSQNVRKGRAFGNIGVTTTQQMIQAERDIDTFNIYDIIIKDFISRFCLLVY